MIDWSSFLQRWQTPRQQADAEFCMSPATNGEVQALADRLGFALPPSYVAFLRVTNGWGPVSPFISRLRSVEDVDWFRVENEMWIEDFQGCGVDTLSPEFFDYSRNYGGDYIEGHLEGTLQISDVDDGVVLMNPEIVTPDGEWEVWFFASWLPGAMRYPSFGHWMVHEYRSFLEEQNVPENELVPHLEIPAPSLPRHPAPRIGHSVKVRLTLEELLVQLDSEDERIRSKAMRVLSGRHRRRPGTQRRPELIAPICDLFYRSKDHQVRTLCISLLTEFAEDTAPPPLFDALSDPDPSVFSYGVSALHWFPDPRAWEPLCRYLESDNPPMWKENAMSQLGTIGDERAIPSLKRILLNPDWPFEQSFGTAAMALAKCGPRGFEVLAEARTHSDPRIRFAAAVGIDVSGDDRGSALLDELERDPAPKVSGRARNRMGKRL